MEGQKKGNNGMFKLLGAVLTLGFIVGLGYVIVQEIPDVERYLRIRSM